MKIFANIMKVLTALATVAGIVYVVATYGDKIVAWAKKIWASMPCPKCEEAEPAAEEVPAEETVEAPVEEAPAEEAPAEEVAEVVVEENEPVAEEADFAE